MEDERWLVTNPPIEEADMVIYCDEDVYIPIREGVDPPKFFFKHYEGCNRNCWLKLKNE
jgi:hypothetical protein